MERFWSSFNPADRTSETLFSLLHDQLSSLIGNEPGKLVAQTYDGAEWCQQRSLSKNEGGVQ